MIEAIIREWQKPYQIRHWFPHQNNILDDILWQLEEKPPSWNNQNNFTSRNEKFALLCAGSSTELSRTWWNISVVNSSWMVHFRKRLQSCNFLIVPYKNCFGKWWINYCDNALNWIELSRNLKVFVLWEIYHLRSDGSCDCRLDTSWWCLLQVEI